MNDPFLNMLNSVVANATPLVIASMGEVLTERAGVINLSLNGSILLSAMVGVAAASISGTALVGIVAAALMGALIALLLAFTAIRLRQDQVAVGFVLTLLCGDLARFLGKPFNNLPNPIIVPNLPIPILSEIPVIGRVFFQHDIFVYFSVLLVIAVWWWLYRTRPGLTLRAIGERPEAAFSRGARVNLLRYLYTAIGGALVGVAGAAYSLGIKAGWSSSPTMDGDGWIALAIVIFAGWHPFRVVFGAYLLAAMRAIASGIQQSPDIHISPVLLNMLPWLLMLGTLIVVSGGVVERLVRLMPIRFQDSARTLLRSTPPASLGTRFDGD